MYISIYISYVSKSIADHLESVKSICPDVTSVTFSGLVEYFRTVPSLVLCDQEALYTNSFELRFPDTRAGISIRPHA